MPYNRIWELIIRTWIDTWKNSKYHPHCIFIFFWYETILFDNHTGFQIRIKIHEKNYLEGKTLLILILFSFRRRTQDLVSVLYIDWYWMIQNLINYYFFTNVLLVGGLSVPLFSTHSVFSPNSIALILKHFF